MIDVHLRRLAARQLDIVAAWQLRDAGASWGMICHRAEGLGWRVVHDGVYALCHAPLVRHQLWIAATLTTRESVLSHASAAACWGFRPFDAGYETITRPGGGGKLRHSGLLVYRSQTLSGHVTRRDAIGITSAARTLIDIAPMLGDRALARTFREALRLKTTTASLLLSTLWDHRGRRGTARLRDLAARYAHLPYARTRSNAEARAIELLNDAGIPAPQVNVRIAGEEADLAWTDRRLIVEIDGPQYHQLSDDDARKQRQWEATGYTVRRIGSDEVYESPDALVALARVRPRSAPREWP